jgi:hypothetical protein
MLYGWAEYTGESFVIRTSSKDFIIATVICGAVALLFAIANANIRHCFVFPVLLCGVLIGGDAVAWIRGKLNLFDPVGIIGVLGLHFFFLAPLLHVYWDHWMKYVQPLPDWRPWLGYMAILNAMGLVLYRFFVETLPFKRFAQRLNAPRTIDHRRLITVLAILLPLTFILQIVVYTRFGGILGYVDAYSTRDAMFEGTGWIFALSESFPILVAIGCVHWIQRQRVWPKWTGLAVFLFGFLLLQLLFGGLRGSRSTTIWKLFWTVGMLHLTVRPIPKKMLVSGALLVVIFMYVYGFYKGAGRDALDLLKDGTSIAEEQTGRTLKDVILGDLGRSDVQAYLLHDSITHADENKLAFGRTYLGAVCILIPKQLWPNRPAGKVKEGTDALYGHGAWDSGSVASNVYGLAGEAILNFGFLWVPLAYALLGCLVGVTRRCIYSLRQGDGRLLLIPFLVNFCVVMMIGDSDNLLFFAFKNGLLPVSLIWFCLSIPVPVYSEVPAGNQTNPLHPQPKL